MTVLAPPRHPHLELALADARAWCHGEIIDQRPALSHAVQVAVVTGAAARQHPQHPLLPVAALLHDSPIFAPPGLDLDAYLDRRYGPAISRLVRGFERDHAAMDTDDPTIDLSDPDVVLLSTADKVVALSSMLRRCRRAADRCAFFAVRHPFLRLMPYFHACHAAAEPHVPADLSAAFARVLAGLDEAVATAGLTSGAAP
jgi:hypothetical protein